MLEFISGEVAVDPYVDHADLEAILKLRLSQGWTLVQTIECAPAVTAPARDMLTLIWNKVEYKTKATTYQETVISGTPYTQKITE